MPFFGTVKFKKKKKEKKRFNVKIQCIPEAYSAMREKQK